MGKAIVLENARGITVGTQKLKNVNKPVTVVIMIMMDIVCLVVQQVIKVIGSIVMQKKNVNTKYITKLSVLHM